MKRLDAAGAVLVAKMTLGALAHGRSMVWGDGRGIRGTRGRESSGASAGPASAVAAGCVGFAIGTETLGSISSPEHAVRRDGAAADVWVGAADGSDGAELDDGQDWADCAERGGLRAGADAIYGPDGQGRFVQDAAFNWNAELDWKGCGLGI